MASSPQLQRDEAPSASFGASVAPPTSASESKQIMAGMSDLPDEPQSSPTHSFVPNPPAHYPPFPSSYPFPRGNGNFPVDQDMQMVQELSHDLQQNMGDQTPTSAPRSNSNGQHHGMDLPQMSPGGPGMAPPNHRNSQSYSSAPQTAVENISDQNAMGDGKRKRSKVSRACDECRRKKIRCDATDDDGTVKTCSNCTRNQQTCSFSRIPMKRGPSKGYIKELSERVQQVESLQMAMSGPSGYRPSIDSDYSPEEPFSAGRRNFSFSSSGGPFAQFSNRDRIPSTGGWGLGSPTAGYSTRDARASIAIAPDQQLPDVTSNFNGHAATSSRPFWANAIDGEHRPVKRQRISSDDQTYKPMDFIEQESLANYFETIHRALPILPKQATTIVSHLQSSPSRLTHAFSYVLNAAQGRDQDPNNAFPDYKAVENYVWSQAVYQPSFRTTGENLIWLWTYLFMIINCDNDLGRLRGSEGGFSKSTLVKLANDLGSFAMNKVKTITPPAEDSVEDLTKRGWYCIGIFAASHAISTASECLTPANTKTGVFADMTNVLPDAAALLAKSAGLLAILQSSVASQSFGQASQSFVARNRSLIEEQLSIVVASAPQHPELDIIARELHLFVAIILARHTFINHPGEILEPTLELAEILLANTTATDVAPKYNPLDIHFFALATITLLEFKESVDASLAQSALDALPKLQRALEQVAERTNPPSGQAVGADSNHWADCLLRVISSTLPSRDASGSNGVNRQEGDAASSADDGIGAAVGSVNLLPGQQMSIKQAAQMSGHYGQGDKMIDSRTGTVQLVDFRLLLETGYLNVVADLCGI